MGLAEGTPPADCAEALPRIGHGWGDFQPFTPFGQPEPASCSAYQPAHARDFSLQSFFPRTGDLPAAVLDCMSCMYKADTSLPDVKVFRVLTVDVTCSSGKGSWQRSAPGTDLWMGGDLHRRIAQSTGGHTWCGASGWPVWLCLASLMQSRARF